MKLCVRCKAAENPASNVSFRETPDGILCSRCINKNTGNLSTGQRSVESEGCPLIKLLGGKLVIACPSCTGRQGSCTTCNGLGAVKIDPKILKEYEPS